MTTSLGDGARALIQPITSSWRATAKLPLAEPQNPRYLDKIALADLLCLDIKATMVMFAQPLGSQLAVMRNFIAILLIVVVPRRIAGDG
ncbi:MULTISPECIES: hypothetical protein [unclassified Bradyrhizobium]|uniref:hypothetical protein n=1 Tax=unclassified Bradyrhizobium TaxID=2631580 RepID=UPI0028E566E4|nr:MULTISPECIES: hypothetical protein [unclassified Bradyrhizobium]